MLSVSAVLLTMVVDPSSLSDDPMIRALIHLTGGWYQATRDFLGASLQGKSGETLQQLLQCVPESRPHVPLVRRDASTYAKQNILGQFVHLVLQSQYEEHGGYCAVCGDEYEGEDRPHEVPGEFATGILGRSYFEPGQVTYF